MPLQYHVFKAIMNLKKPFGWSSRVGFLWGFFPPAHVTWNTHQPGSLLQFLSGFKTFCSHSKVNNSGRQSRYIKQGSQFAKACLPWLRNALMLAFYRFTGKYIQMAEILSSVHPLIIMSLSRVLLSRGCLNTERKRELPAYNHCVCVCSWQRQECVRVRVCVVVGLFFVKYASHLVLFFPLTTDAY